MTKSCFWFDITFFCPTNRALDKTPGRFRPADFDGKGPEFKFREKLGNSDGRTDGRTDRTAQTSFLAWTYVFSTNRALDKTPGRFRPAGFHGRSPEAGFQVNTCKMWRTKTRTGRTGRTDRTDRPAKLPGGVRRGGSPPGRVNQKKH